MDARPMIICFGQMAKQMWAKFYLVLQKLENVAVNLKTTDESRKKSTSCKSPNCKHTLRLKDKSQYFLLVWFMSKRRVHTENGIYVFIFQVFMWLRAFVWYIDKICHRIVQDVTLIVQQFKTSQNCYCFFCRDGWPIFVVYFYVFVLYLLKDLWYLCPLEYQGYTQFPLSPLDCTGM